MSLRFDPFRDSLREMDRLTNQLLSGTAMPASMPMDLWRDGDMYVVAFDLPGIDESTLDVTLERGALTIRAERTRSFDEGTEVLVAERPQGAFTRQLILGDGLDQDNVQADYRDGVLELRIPVAQAAQPRRVSVRHSGGSAVSGSSERPQVTTGS